MKLSSIKRGRKTLWLNKKVAVYGNIQGKKNAYLFDAITQQRSWPGYDELSTHVVVKICTDNSWAPPKKSVRADQCEILEEL